MIFFDFLLPTLAAIFLVVGFIYLAFALTRFILPAVPGQVAFTASVLVSGLWLSTMVFHLLATFGLFKLWPAFLLILLAGFVAHISGYPIQVFVKDFSAIFPKKLRFPPWLATRGLRPLLLVQILAGAVTATRALLLPPLGWDTLTYHLTKAGLWVQSGGYDTLQTPGAWGYYYRNLFGGGEIFTAWAMLPFQRDLLAGAVDVFQWLALGWTIFSLGRTLGISAAKAWIGAGYVIFLPAVWLAVGSGYVDTGMLLALCLGMLFTLLFTQEMQLSHLVLAAMAFGVAAGIKIVAIPTVGLVAVVSLTALWINRKTLVTKPAAWAWIAGAGLAGVLPVIPWLALNLARTGTLLGTIPLQIGDLALGVSSPTLAWYMERPELVGAGPAEEIVALARMFRSPFTATPHLGIFTLVSIFLFPVSLYRLGKHQRWATALLACFAVGALVAFYLPGFRSIRLLWPLVSGRFLLPLVVAATLWSLWDRRQELSPHAWLLGAGTVLHIVGSLFFGWADFEYTTILAWLALFTLLGFFTWRRWRRIHNHFYRILVVIAIFMLFIPVLGIYRQMTRYTSAALSTIYDPVHTYWLPAAHAADEPGQPAIIAITAGPDQDADNWFLAFFLGSRFQNKLAYVPVLPDGSVMDFDPAYSLANSADQPAWLERIKKEQVDFVMSFTPASIELDWMENDPGRFTRVYGDGQSWGFYRVNP